MLTPSGVTLSQYINAVKQDATAHVRITFLGQNIVLEDADVHSNGIVIQDCLNGDVDLCFGKAVSRAISIPILNSSKLNGIIWSSEIKVEFGIEISGSTEWVTYGYFTGTRPDKIYNVDVIEYSAYDRMQKFDVLADDWMESLTYPKTVWQMFTSLCDYVGVEYVAGNELANIKARSFASSPFAQVTGVSCRTILAAIAEACGCYARINSANKCQMVWFTDHTSDYTLVGNDEFNVSMMDDVPAKTHADLEAYTHADLEHFTHADLMGTKAQFRVYAVNVKQTEDDIGVVYPSETNGNVYYIIDNPFLVTANSTEVNNYIKPIYDRLAAFGGYLPMAVSAIGNALIETGDIITVTVGNATYAMPIFVKNTGFNGAILDMYECTGQFNRTTISPENRMKLSQGGQYHKWKNTVDQLYSELYDPTTGDVSILKQTAQELGLSAAGIDIQGGKYIRIQSGGVFDVQSTNFSISSANKRMTMGNWRFDDNGMLYYDSSIQTGFEIADIDDKSSNVSGIYYDHIVFSDHSESGIVKILVNNKYGSIYDDAYFSFYNQYNSDTNNYQKFFLPDNDGHESVIGSVGNPFRYANINQLNVSYILPRSADYTLGFVGTSVHPFYNGYIRSIRTNKLYVLDDVDNNLEVYGNISGYSSDGYIRVGNSGTEVYAYLWSGASGNHGIYSNGYWNGSQKVADGKWMLYRGTDGVIHLSGDADTVDGYHAASFTKKAGDTMTGNLNVQTAGETFVGVKNTNTGAVVFLDSAASLHGLNSNGYWNGSSYVSDPKWMVYRDTNGNIQLNGNAASATTVNENGLSYATLNTTYCTDGSPYVFKSGRFIGFGGFVKIRSTADVSGDGTVLFTTAEGYRPGTGKSSVLLCPQNENKAPTICTWKTNGEVTLNSGSNGVLKKGEWYFVFGYACNANAL